MAEPASARGSIEDLMQLYQHSDSEAAVHLVNELSPQIFRFYLAQVRDRTHAEDLLQDFWLRVHNARHTYRSPEPLLPWLYAIARRVRIDQYRKSRNMQHHEVPTDVLPERVAHTGTASNLLNIHDLLESLPESQRQTILMLKVAGLSLEEAARALGTTVGAVKQKAHRAYTTLRKMFGPDL